MKPLFVFYHSWYSPNALPIIREQMRTLKESGLEDAAQHIVIGLNGQPDGQVEFPAKASIVVHPPESANENITIDQAHRYAINQPGGYLLYFHSKGATHEPGHWCIPLMEGWRRCMMHHCVEQWRTCVADLDAGVDACGTHWLDKAAYNLPVASHFGGNFWWATTDFLATVPSLYERHKSRTGHLGSVENRYEAEVWLAHGPNQPSVKDYHPGHPGVHG